MNDECVDNPLRPLHIWPKPYAKRTKRVHPHNQERTSVGVAVACRCSIETERQAVRNEVRVRGCEPSLGVSRNVGAPAFTSCRDDVDYSTCIIQGIFDVITGVRIQVHTLRNTIRRDIGCLVRLQLLELSTSDFHRE